MSEAAAPTAASSQLIGIGSLTAKGGFFLNITVPGVQSGVPAPSPIGLSPHSNGPAVRAAREAIGLSRAELVARSNGAFDEAWLDVAEAGGRVDAGQLSALAARLEVQPSDLTLREDQRPPYRGLLAFEPEDAALFGGREEATGEILALLERHPIVAVIGASGSGKSSVVKAGVVPVLSARQDPPWRGLILRPGADPLLALARAFGGDLDRGADEDARLVNARERADVLAAGRVPLSDYLDRIAELRTQAGVAPRLLLFVDQWEELYTQTLDPARRGLFVDHLSAAFAGGPHRLILTMRADFTGRLLEDRRSFFDAAKPGMLPLPRMSHPELARAIRKPAGAVGYAVEDALVETILKDAGEEPGSLALVEFTLTELWRARDVADRRLTLSAYAAMGGLRGAIDRHAEAVYARLSPERQSAVRRALTRLVHISTLETYTRQRHPLSAFDAAGRQALQDLAGEENRLVVISRAEGREAEDGSDRTQETGQAAEAQPQDAVEVAHEAVIREWKRLHGWVSADPAFLQWREGVERRLRRYDDKGQRDEDLLQGLDLEEAQSWLRTRGGLPEMASASLSPNTADPTVGTTGSPASPAAASTADPDISAAVRTFIVASLARQAALEAERRAVEEQRRQAELDRALAAQQFAEAQAQAAEQRRQAELDRALAAQQFAEAQNKASSRLTRLGVAAASILAIAVVILGGVALWGNSQRKNADTRTVEARLNQVAALSALSSVALPTDPALATKLALAAWPRQAQGDPTPKRAVALAALGTAVSDLHERRGLRGHTDTVTSAAFSPDGRQVVTASVDGTARVWDAATGQSLAVLTGHTGWVWNAVFSPDGRRIVTASWDNTARVWDAATGQSLAVLTSHKDRVWSAAFSPDGQSVVTASDDKTARVWDAATGRSLAVLTGHADTVSSAAFSPDGRRVVTASWDNAARVWDAATGRSLAVLTGHVRLVSSAAFSPDGRRVVTASVDKTARVWDAATGQSLVALEGHTNVLLSAAFSPDSHRVVTASWDRTGRVWDASTGQTLAFLNDHTNTVSSAVFSSDGRSVVTASWDKTARVWDAITGRSLTVLNGHAKPVSSAAFSPDGRRVVTASWDNTARVWDAATGHSLAFLTGHTDTVSSAAFSPDGRRVVTASRDWTARVWDATTGQSLAVLERHNGPVLSAAFSPDGRRVVTASADKTVRLWDAVTGQSLAALKGHTGPVSSAAFSPDGRRVVTASDDKTAQVWDATTKQSLAALNGHTNTVSSAAFSPDGRRVVTASQDEMAQVWDATTGRRLAVLTGHTGKVSSATFSPDGQSVVTASRDKTARVWDAATGQNLVILNGHTDVLSSAAFSPDGQRVVTASDDKTARVWDLATGQSLAVITGHADTVSSAAFSPDGRRVVTASRDNTARVWEVGSIPPGNVFEVACAWLPDRDLSGLSKDYGLTALEPICKDRPPLPSLEHRPVK